MSQTEEFRVAAAGVPSTAQTGRGGPTASVAGAGTAADLPQRLGLFWTFWRSIVPVGVPPKRGFDPSAVPPASAAEPGDLMSGSRPTTSASG